LKPDVLNPDVLKPDVLKPEVLWVYLFYSVPNPYRPLSILYLSTVCSSLGYLDKTVGAFHIQVKNLCEVATISYNTQKRRVSF
jgi:hypothetical protein